MPTLVKRLGPVVILVVAIVAFAACLHRRPSVLPTFRYRRLILPIPNAGGIWPGLRHSSPLIALLVLVVVVLIGSYNPHPIDPPAIGRALAASAISSRGGFRIPEVALLGATPQSVSVPSRPVGPPSPDPLQLAAARLALTPTPTPRPTLLPLEAAAGPSHRDLGVFRVSGYSDSPYLNGTDGRGITKSGAKTHWGCVAVDPRVIPLGTRLTIESFEGTVFTALDTGGGVLGRWVDIWFPTDYDAIQHGLRSLAVTVIGGN